MLYKYLSYGVMLAVGILIISCDITGEETCKTRACQKIYTPQLEVYIARGPADNPHASSITEANVIEMITGWGLNSVNPILLQFDVAFLRENITIHNVLLKPNRIVPDGDDAGKRHYNWIDFANDGLFALGGRFPTQIRLDETDLLGNKTGQRLEVDPVSHHLLLLEFGPTGGYTGGARSGIVCTIEHCTRNVLAHEFGHMFGLNHYVRDKENRVMSAIVYDDDVLITPTERGIVADWIDKNYLNPTPSVVARVSELPQEFKDRMMAGMSIAYVGFDKISELIYNSALDLVPIVKAFWNSNKNLLGM